MEKAGAYFGTPPPLASDVTDTAGVLRPADQKRIRRSIAAFQDRFPQSRFSAAFMALSRDVPGPAYTYWLFNRCHPAGDGTPGTSSRNLFLLVDTAGRHAWMTIGYGLEPFISAHRLQQTLDKARPFFEQAGYVEGVSALIAELSVVFHEAVSSLPRVFGLSASSAPARKTA